MSHDPLVQMAFLTRQEKVWFSLPFKPFVHNLSQKRPIKCLFYLPWDSFQPVSPNQPYLDCIGPYWGGELDLVTHPVLELKEIFFWFKL